VFERGNNIRCLVFEEKDRNIHVCPWHMGHWLLLLRNACGAQYLNRLIWQRDDFESNGKDRVRMAYGGHHNVMGGIKITDDYEGCLYAMVMIEGMEHDQVCC
jgi:hypothetical protein